MNRLVFTGRIFGNFPRTFATRHANEFPFDKLVNIKKPFFNWKACGVFFLGGSYLAYSEILFQKYSEYTQVDDDSELLSIQLDYKLKTLPIYQQLAHGKKSGDWIKLNSWENLDRNVLEGAEGKLVKGQAEYLSPDFTNHTLAHPGGILVKPVIFHNHITNETVTIVHMGYKLCGYPFIVHGGIIATLLNECFKRCASLSASTQSSLKDDYMIDSLGISYKSPSFANQFFVVKTRVESRNSNDSLVLKSVIENENGKVVVDGNSVVKETGRATKLACESQASKWALF
ncbi:hypothetical protein FOB63_002945 [Clavispora lusitaniae]|uniref:uncharacterized protein n=1 Tax=Clavispora lusitaniae TaxID=36911 RepID=UPI00202C63E6|nr:hypothetical protein FOB63_002945 [Clavispora lusitaniae]